MATEIRIDTEVGAFAGLDFGGAGPDLLLVHQPIMNAQVWAPFGELLAEHFHTVAIDLRGHGRTMLPLDRAEQSWEDFGPITRALGLRTPLVVTEGVSEVAAIRAVHGGHLDALGLVLVGDANPYRGAQARQRVEDYWPVDDADTWWIDRFGLFARGTTQAQREAYLEERVAKSTQDWLIAGVPADYWRNCVTRSLVDTDAGWHRRPDRSTYRRLASALAEGPLGLDLYDSVDTPITFINTSQQLTPTDMVALEGYAGRRPNTGFYVADGGPVLGLIHPSELRGIIRPFATRLLARRRG